MRINIFHKYKLKCKKTLLKFERSSEKSYIYDREAAKLYAETYAESPNVKDFPLYKENDCTNFVSQALLAGGMKMIGTDYGDFSQWFCYTKDQSNLKKCSLTWRSSEYFRLYWGNNGSSGKEMAKEYKEFTVEEAIQKFDELYSYLLIGDIVQYADENRVPYHSQIIISKEFNIRSDKNDMFVAQHSANRKHVSLHEYWRLLRNGKGRYVYIYHF